MRTFEVLLAVVVSSVGAVAASGQAPPPDLAAENRALVQRLVLERAAAIAAVQRIADEREEQLFAELASKDRRLRAEQRTRKETQAELVKVTKERQRLVDEIASRDRRFAAEIEEYRRQVASIADSPDPRKREALKRYADGDRAGGFDTLIAIQKAETKAVAAGWREIAALALDRKDRGEMGTTEVIPLYETAQTMDADYAWGWIELRRLYQEAGRLQDAKRAAEQALAHAQSDRERAVAESELGDVLVVTGALTEAYDHLEENFKILKEQMMTGPGSTDAQRDLAISLDQLGKVLVALGDLEGARDKIMESLNIRKRLAEDNTGNSDAQRGLRDGLISIGDVLVASGNLSGAYVRYENSLKISRDLVEKNPGSVNAQRDLAVSLNRLGGVLIGLWRLELARALCEESLEISKRLAEANPSSADAQQDLSVALERLGEGLVASGDLAGARNRFEESLKIREQLAAANPGSAAAQRDLSVSISRLGEVLVASGDLAGASNNFMQSLKISERLAATTPASAGAKRDLIAIHAKLGRLPGGELHWSEALRIALELQSQGRLAPGDAWMIEELQRQVAAGNVKP